MRVYDVSLKNSEQLEKESINNIAEYGFKNSEHNENFDKEETYRTSIRRQRDKILYTGGFRRLQGKTQVIEATLSGDHRTRLTHTLEVEQLSVSIANALSLNEDLVSAIALGHDVGHTPFGHAAERELNKLLKENGGFHHPIQSVKYLWGKYKNKLQKEVYEGILLHDSDMFTIDIEEAKKQFELDIWENENENGNEKEKLILNIPIEEFLGKFPSTLEAQVVVWADKIAYITHDIEDFLKSSMYTSIKKAEGDIQCTENELLQVLNDLKLYEKELESISDFRQRDLIRNLTTNLIENSAKNITMLEQTIKRENEIRLKKIKKILKREKKQYLDNLIINFDEKYRDGYYKLRKFLDKNYILSPEVQRSDAKAQRIVSLLFNEFKNNYKLLPLNVRKKIDLALKKEANKIIEETMKRKNINNIENIEKMEEILKQNNEKYTEYKNRKKGIIERVVAYYIATMTDSYTKTSYFNLFLENDNRYI